MEGFVKKGRGGYSQHRLRSKDLGRGKIGLFGLSSRRREVVAWLELGELGIWSNIGSLLLSPSEMVVLSSGKLVLMLF